MRYKSKSRFKRTRRRSKASSSRKTRRRTRRRRKTRKTRSTRSTRSRSRSRSKSRSRRNNFIFTEDDYNSRDGMLTTIWGPTLWHSMHTISFNYPNKPTEEQKRYHMNWFTSLQGVLPCGACRDNLRKNLKKLPLTKTVLKNRHNFSKWVYDLHELVNKMLGKKSGLTYEQVRDRYENFRARCNLKGMSKSNSKSNSKPRKRSNTKRKSKTKQSDKKESGCTNPLYGIKSQVLIDIVPCTGKNKKRSTLTINPKCKLKRCTCLIHPKHLSKCPIH